MAGFMLTGTLPDGNPARVRKLMWEAYARLWGDAAMYAVKVAATKVAVDTGMSAASLIPAAEKAGVLAGRIGEGEVLEADIKSRQKRTRRKGLTLMDENYRGDRYKEIKEGIAAGKDFTTVEAGDPSNPKFVFEFIINVFQYEFWESAWGSLEAGTQAFINFLNENFDRYMPTFDKLFPPKRLG